ncbi:MAG: DUF378 domain-containing protein [Clostridiales bacterium]|nr:DUF378 domain-containing protein [Clostridiales bacterium]
MLDKISLILVVIGALNWGSIGLFQFDIVAWIFGGQAGGESPLTSRGRQCRQTFRADSVIYLLRYLPDFCLSNCRERRGIVKGNVIRKRQQPLSHADA